MTEQPAIAEGLQDRAIDVFEALAHELRFRIVLRLGRHGSVTPNELADLLGTSQQNVSKHLKSLLQAGLVSRRKDGSSAIYTLRHDAALGLIESAVEIARREVTAQSSEAGLLGVERDGSGRGSATG